MTATGDVMRPSARARLISAIGTAIVLSLFGYALLLGLTVQIRAPGEQPTMLLGIAAPRPRPRPIRPAAKPATHKPATHQAPGKAASRNLESRAAEIVVPPAPTAPTPPPVIAASVAGPGMGAGRQGAGSGIGDAGDDDGDGGDDIPPRQIGGRLQVSDLPPGLRDGGIRGIVSVEYDVETDGHVGHCIVTRSSGSAELDQLTCRLIEQRFRYEPSRNREGQPVSSTIEEDHHWDIDRNSRLDDRR